MKYVVAAVLMGFLGIAPIEAKQDLKIDMKESKVLGNELRRELDEMFKSEKLLSQDDLLPDSQKGKQFDSTNLTSTPLALVLVGLFLKKESGVTIGAITTILSSKIPDRSFKSLRISKQNLIGVISSP